MKERNPNQSNDQNTNQTGKQDNGGRDDHGRKFGPQDDDQIGPIPAAKPGEGRSDKAQGDQGHAQGQAHSNIDQDRSRQR